MDVQADGQREMSLVDVLVQAEFATSKTKARQLLAQSGVKVEGSKANLESTLTTTGTVVVQVGKRNYKRIRFV